MRRSIVVVGVAWFLLGVAPPAARADMYEVQGRPGHLVLAVLEGEVWLFEGGVPNDASRDWGLISTPGKHPLPLSGGRKTWYLAFDAEGESKRVRLASDQFTGTTWVFAKAEGGAVTTYTIRAGEGKLKGWYLDREEKGRRFKATCGKRCTGYRAVLSKKPRLAKFSFIVIAP